VAHQQLPGASVLVRIVFTCLQVRSLAMQRGTWLGKEEEQMEAELLRQACHDALCRGRKRSRQFPDARKQVRAPAAPARRTWRLCTSAWHS
jgi:hypothetical protein